MERQATGEVRQACAKHTAELKGRVLTCGERYLQDRILVVLRAVPDCGTSGSESARAGYVDVQDKDTRSVQELQRVRSSSSACHVDSWAGGMLADGRDAVVVGSLQRKGLGVDWLAAFDVDLCGMGSRERHMQDRKLVGVRAVPRWAIFARERVCVSYVGEQDEGRAGVEDLQRTADLEACVLPGGMKRMRWWRVACREGGLGVVWLVTSGVELCGLGSGKRHLQDRKLAEERRVQDRELVAVQAVPVPDCGIAARQCVCT
ncbi:uncharacterized protein EMH_0006190 [Eimeria mitis]|uniref:Uncharacterized protein n=1 Tax=Eimeria mitis TaxID=44415 RepID=U6K060_9EIME|nr:uncharacterized protein EMH_0006190 [Eimeria mitis]CDJ30346.1 hypothetical protein EMH_0006190 [Eimeria mitis]